MTGTELARRDQDAFELGKVFADSGMFPNVRKANEAIVKIIAGREFGLGPMAAMNGIHMVDGKPTLAANLIAGQIKRHPSYNYTVHRRDESGCALEFFEDGKTCSRDSQGRPAPGTPSITFEKTDADRAGLLGKQNWRKYPRDMYFARCLTAGARTFCPDVLGGSPIYTAEELDADVSETQQDLAPAPPTAEVIDAVVVPNVTEGPLSSGVLDQLRDLFKSSGTTDDQLCWMLLSVGVQSLPGDPSRADIGAAMKGLTLEQAFKLEELLKGEDGTVPGSGEAS